MGEMGQYGHQKMHIILLYKPINYGLNWWAYIGVLRVKDVLTFLPTKTLPGKKSLRIRTKLHNHFRLETGPIWTFYGSKICVFNRARALWWQITIIRAIKALIAIKCSQRLAGAVGLPAAAGTVKIIENIDTF